jgi:pimeloyl-ACP methyl ester carboxylesterase
MRSQRVRFQGSEGIELKAVLDGPDEGLPAAFAVFAHCFTCTKDYKIIVGINRVLTQGGWGVLRFDFPGLGESGGRFGETNFSSNVRDLLAAASFLEANFGPPRLLLGHSLGGAAALAAAGRVPTLGGVVTLAAPAEPLRLTRHFEERIEEILSRGEAQVLVSGRPFPITRQFVEDLRGIRLVDSVRSLSCPLLVCHSPQDSVVPVSNGEEIFAAAPHPKSFVALRGDHLLLEEEDVRYAGRVIASWAEPIARAG